MDSRRVPEVDSNLWAQVRCVGESGSRRRKCPGDRMKLAARVVLLFVLASCFAILPHKSLAQTAAVAPRITTAIDNQSLTTLHGNVHPLARGEFDQGAAVDAQALHRMLLLLKRSPEQETALQQLLSDQQDKTS